MQLTFIIKTQQLSLTAQQHVRNSLFVSCVNSASELPACTCTGQQKLLVALGTGSSGDSQHHAAFPAPHHITPMRLWLSSVPCGLPLSQGAGWGMEQHQ